MKTWRCLHTLPAFKLTPAARGETSEDVLAFSSKEAEEEHIGCASRIEVEEERGPDTSQYLERLFASTRDAEVMHEHRYDFLEDTRRAASPMN
jgi:hypothetical protein